MRCVLWMMLCVFATGGCGRPSGTAPVSPVVKNPATELVGALTWFNSSATQLSPLRGKVVVLHFFEYGSARCLRDLPYLKEWLKRYGGQGLAVIGIHLAEHDFALDPVNVNAGIKRIGISYSVAMDSSFKIAESYQIRSVPHLVLVDKDGIIRYERAGAGDYEAAELKIQQLLLETNPALRFPVPMSPVRSADRPGAVCYPVTPSVCVGRNCGPLGNAPLSITNEVATYRFPTKRQEGRVYVAGQWSQQETYLRHAADAADPLADCLSLRYRAIEVNVVMKPEDIYWKEVFVQQDGQWLSREVAGSDIKYDAQGRSYVQVNMAGLYNLIAGQPYGAYELRLFTQGKGLSVYSFSFGTSEIPERVERRRSAK